MQGRFSRWSFLLGAVPAACSGSSGNLAPVPDAAAAATSGDAGSPGTPRQDAGGSTPGDDASGPPSPADEAGVTPTGDSGPGNSNVDAGSTAGCGKGGSKVGDFTLTAMVGGVSRSVEVLVPAGYTSAAPVPLVFVFHGAGGTSAQAESYGLQDGAKAAGDTAIFAYPQGVAQGNSGVGWDLTCAGDDVAFFDAVRSKLEEQYCIAADRVFVAGFSWGGDFSNTLGCCRGDLIRAIAPASGAFYTSASSCTSAAPGYRLTSGTADPNYMQSEFANAVAHYAKANGCSATTSPASPSPCVAYGGCKQPVVWCSYAGMAHQLPDHWPDDAWAFLASFQ
jgi:polyhydroxybutyrate depolymerase